MVRKSAEAVCQKRMELYCAMIRESKGPSRFDAATKTTVMRSRRTRKELSYEM